MSGDPITAQRGEELLSHLTSHGWRVVERSREMLDWWADEIWTIDSVWTPSGVRAYLTFLVDPIDTSEVWALTATASRPQDRGEAESGHLIRLHHVWQKELDAWLDGLKDLRSVQSTR